MLMTGIALLAFAYRRIAAKILIALSQLERFQIVEGKLQRGPPLFDGGLAVTLT